MTETDAKPTAPAAPAAKLPKGAAKKLSGRPRPGLTGGLALILAALALIAGSYLWYTLLYERQELLTTDIVGTLTRLEDGAKSTQENLAAAEAELQTLKATQDTLKSAVDKIQSDLGRHRMEWVLAETEQLLVIANNRLQLARDVRSALNALRAADRQLQTIANPNLLPVRRELAREITLLEALDKADLTGITLRLGSLAETVDRLPLALEARMREAPPAEAKAPAGETGTDAPPDSWRATARGMWTDILSLVRIRTNLETQKPLLPPEQQYFLRENLRLLLIGSQHALLQGNTATYQQNLKSAQRLLKDYFDVNTQVVAAVSAELEKLQTAKIVTELPDISASLEMLRRVAGRKAGA
jgi:uncharacterized protein HemX